VPHWHRREATKRLPAIINRSPRALALVHGGPFMGMDTHNFLGPVVIHSQELQQTMRFRTLDKREPWDPVSRRLLLFSTKVWI
jgi:hypothetical protein